MPLGFGFRDRGSALDLRAALSDRIRLVHRQLGIVKKTDDSSTHMFDNSNMDSAELDDADADSKGALEPLPDTLDLSLKDGETLTISTGAFASKQSSHGPDEPRTLKAAKPVRLAPPPASGSVALPSPTTAAPRKQKPKKNKKSKKKKIKPPKKKATATTAADSQTAADDDWFDDDDFVSADAQAGSAPPGGIGFDTRTALTDATTLSDNADDNDDWGDFE